MTGLFAVINDYFNPARHLLSEAIARSSTEAYLLGSSSNNLNLSRIVRVSMPSLEEELLTEMPRLSGCCIVRVKREFQIRLRGCLNLLETVTDEKQAS